MRKHEPSSPAVWLRARRLSRRMAQQASPKSQSKAQALAASQTGWHTEPCAMKRLLLLLTPLLVSANPVSAWERFDPDEGYKNCVDTALREWLDQEKWRSLNRVEKSAYKSLAHQRCNSSVPEQFQTDMGK